jgi:leader peptidase (prepilin peptidase)/N-methyltransferase
MMCSANWIEPAFITGDLVWIVYTLSTIYGLCVGSFLNVVGLRLLKDEGFVWKPSYCPQCNTPLRWYHNIPVLSYLFLGGKCSVCKTPISIQYPLIELLTAGLFCLIVWQFGVGWGSLALLWLIANLVVILITDIKESLIFTLNAYLAVPVGLLANALGILPKSVSFLIWYPSWLSEADTFFGFPFWSALAGVVGFFLAFEAIIWGSRLVVGEDGFGHGDTLLLMMIASFMGWEMTLGTLVVGGAIQAIASFPYLIFKWAKEKQTKLLGLMGTAIAVVGGSAYLNYFAPSSIALMTDGRPQQWILWVNGGLLLGTVVLMAFILKEVRKQEAFTSLPFGPALIAGAFVMLFFGQPWLAKAVYFIENFRLF